MIWTVALRGDGTYLNVHVGRTQHGKLRFYIEAPSFALAETIALRESEARRPKCDCGMPLPCRVCNQRVAPVAGWNDRATTSSSESSGERSLALELLLEVQAEWLRGPRVGAFAKFLQDRVDRLRKEKP